MDEDSEAEVHICVYSVRLTASGDFLSTAEWTGGSVSINLGPKYQPIQVSFSAGDVASLFGTSVVRHGEERSTTLGFLLLFPLDSDAPWRDGTYSAYWQFKYMTEGRSHPKEVAYAVLCNLPPPIPPLSGRYVLETVNGKPLPQAISRSIIMHADTFTFFPDSTYTARALIEWGHGDFYAGTSERVSYQPYARRRMYLPLLYPSYGAGFATHSDSVIVHTHVVGDDSTVWRFRRIPSSELRSASLAPRTLGPRAPGETRDLRTQLPAVQVRRSARWSD